VGVRVTVQLHLRQLPGAYAVVRLPANAEIPTWAVSGGFFSVSRTPNELSVVCEGALVPAECQQQQGWSLLMLQGPFEFTLTGILTAVLLPLRDAGIGIFAMSTYDTDWVMVAGDHFEQAVVALRAAGHHVEVL
jgi:uncharacterized protein